MSSNSNPSRKKTFTHKVKLIEREYADGKKEYIFYLKTWWGKWFMASWFDDNYPCVFEDKEEALSYLKFYPKTYIENEIKKDI